MSPSVLAASLQPREGVEEEGGRDFPLTHLQETPAHARHCAVCQTVNGTGTMLTTSVLLKSSPRSTSSTTTEAKSLRCVAGVGRPSVLASMQSEAARAAMRKRAP